MSASATPGSQQAFVQALLDPGQPCPAGLRCWNGSDPLVRFDVHRNNVITSLVAALADTFPVCRQLVGAAFFDAMARVFVRWSPPRSPVLASCGDGFPAFIEGFEPAAGVPYLADVARLERQRLRALHAADAPVLPAGRIAQQLGEPASLPASYVDVHPSAGVLCSPFAIVSLWAAHQGAGDIAGVEPRQAECALVVRHHDEVEVVRLAPGSAEFLARLMSGSTLAAAARAAARCDDGFDLAASLGLLIRHGVLTAWHSSGRCAP